MSRDTKSPYSTDAIFAVRKGFKAGICRDYQDFLAQTSHYPGGKEVWAVFTDRQHAQAFVDSGICPVTPIAEKTAPGTFPAPGSLQSLPTPDASPDRENASFLHTRHTGTSNTPLHPSASQPPPAPRKPPATQPEDSGGDTEPEEEFKPPSATLPTTGSVQTSRNPPLRRPYKSGSITEALQRHASMNGGSISSTQVVSPTKTAAPEKPNLFSSTAPAASGSGSSRQPYPSPSKAPGPRTVTVPRPTSTPTPFIVPPAPVVPPTITSFVTPPLVPELQPRPRPRGEYEQCTHCSGHGWILTPTQPTASTSPPQPTTVQTPSRPRSTPTTKLRILSTSDSDSGNKSTGKKYRTPSGSRLRVSSVGGVGPERIPKRESKRTVSDTTFSRRLRIVSDSTKDQGNGKGKGKERAVEMDVDEPGSESGPSIYDYIIYALICFTVVAQYDKLIQLCILMYRYS
ncbi:hypothetical protein RSOLAG1IB_05960 [Rhizoctonia solani AG-1 IB]|uniref:Uncharacterized protein n=1 Tax=Thanatephorus cucumeris (strain AG1-IB / isolate 7/3/14) TaxID=1108050 RepID=A0A0B7F9H9_THACB|nr:hypothetical protein RSOLAG1IB_05960 [Rhizoctonia solani AG-1 IB]